MSLSSGGHALFPPTVRRSPRSRSSHAPVTSTSATTTGGAQPTLMTPSRHLRGLERSPCPSDGVPYRRSPSQARGSCGPPISSGTFRDLLLHLHDPAPSPGCGSPVRPARRPWLFVPPSQSRRRPRGVDPPMAANPPAREGTVVLTGCPTMRSSDPYPPMDVVSCISNALATAGPTPPPHGSQNALRYMLDGHVQ
jgi:hypothetical protein